MTSQKVKWLVQLAGIIFLDILISFMSLGLYHKNGFNFDYSTMQEQLDHLKFGNYNFRKSGIEFALLSLVRLASLLLGITFLRARFCVNVFYQLLMTLFICSISFSLLKVLCFAEIDGQLVFCGIWLNVIWTICVSVFFSLWLHHVIRLTECEYNLVPTKRPKTPEQEQPNGKKKKAEVIRESSITQIIRLLSYARYNGKYFLFGSVFLIIYSVCRVIIPYLTGQIVAAIVSKEAREDGTFYRLVFAMLILVLLASVFGGLRGSCFSYATSIVDRSVRRDLFRSIVQQEIAFFDQTQTGEVLSRLSSDCQLVSTIVSTNVNLFLRSLLMMIGSMIFMVVLSWQLTLITFIVIPPLAFFIKLYGVFYDRLGERTQRVNAEANHVAEEVIGSIRTVKSFACEDKEIARFESKLAKTLKVIQLKALAEVGFSWINDVAEYVVLLAILFYAGHLAVQGKMTVNQITSFLLYQLQLGEVFYYMKLVFSSVMEGVGASRKIFEYMNRRPEIGYNGAVQKPIEGQVDFVNLSFAYPNRPNQKVLKDLTMQIKPGQTAAIVGPSGGGKSTVVAMLQHFYECQNGKVTLDNTIIQQYSHKYYHRNVALVSQEPVLYSGSVRYNILYGCKEGEISDDQMFEAAKLANCHDFILEMKEGYDTLCGEKGVQLSGGQRQRIAICRALVMNPRVLILDEATASLDTVSEKLIQQSLQKCSSNRTVIIIAHRLSTIENADIVFVINKGQLVQSGTHASLSQEEGLYKRLCQRQAFEKIS